MNSSASADAVIMDIEAAVAAAAACSTMENHNNMLQQEEEEEHNIDFCMMIQLLRVDLD